MLRRRRESTLADSHRCGPRRPKARYLCGYMARAIVLMGTLPPTRWFDTIIMRSV